MCLIGQQEPAVKSPVAAGGEQEGRTAGLDLSRNVSLPRGWARAGIMKLKQGCCGVGVVYIQSNIHISVYASQVQNLVLKDVGLTVLLWAPGRSASTG